MKNGNESLKNTQATKKNKKKTKKKTNKQKTNKQKTNKQKKTKNCQQYIFIKIND